MRRPVRDGGGAAGPQVCRGRNAPELAQYRIMSRIGVPRAWFAVCLAFLAGGCASIGPETVPRDRFDYGAAIAGSAKEQLLYNIVGLRYLEAPTFVNVASVINQYSLEGEVALSGGLNTGFEGGADTLSVGGKGVWSDRPTVTYTPLTGEEFANNLLTPIPPESVFALVQAGWPAELLLSLTIKTVNGVENAVASPSARRRAAPAFDELLRVWARLRKARAIGFRREQAGDAARIIVYLSAQRTAPGVAEDIALLRRILRLDPNVVEYRLGYGLVPDEPGEIAVLTLSILELMNELAWRADVPPEHIEDGRTGPGFAEYETGGGFLIRIHHSEGRPDDSYVAVRMRDYWYYIDDRDVVSKRTFAMLQLMLSITDPGEKARGPVVTITN